MNERIKELARQTGFYVSDDKIHIPTTSEDITACQTKFAELIVRECARQVRNTDLEDVEGGDSAVLRAAMRQILEHFGVKS